MQNQLSDKNRARRRAGGSNHAGSRGRRRTGNSGRGRNSSGAPKRSLAAVLLVTLLAAFLIFTEPGKEIISSATGTSEASAQQPSEAPKTASEQETPQPEPDVHRDSQPEEIFSLDMVPAYSGMAYADINGDIPFFTEEEMTSDAFHEYWPLDELGRCTGAFACVGPETLPKEKRGDISEVKPTGWHRSEYSDIDGGLLFNRCHLIGHMLTGQDANERNLITGTRYMNTEGMLPFEESVLMYVEGTGHHVMYRVRPFYEGQNLVASGVLMEAKSVEDPLVQFCAFCYNVQPGFVIDYATGDNRRAETNEKEVQRIVSEDPEEEDAGSRSLTEEEGDDGETLENNSGSGTRNDADAAAESETEVSEEPGEDFNYVLNTNTRKFHMPYCDSVNDIKDKNRKISEEDRDTLIREGYSPCKRCNP